jgi:hypothetical protein
MVKRFSSHFSGLDKDAQILDQLILSGKLTDLGRSYIVLELTLSSSELIFIA